jgi:hypothetical protein
MPLRVARHRTKAVPTPPRPHAYWSGSEGLRQGITELSFPTGLAAYTESTQPYEVVVDDGDSQGDDHYATGHEMLREGRVVSGWLPRRLGDIEAEA